MYSTADVDLLLLFRFRLEFVGIHEVYQIRSKFFAVIGNLRALAESN
jgi:hypothetical protein